jgi:hypothetical protein
MLTVLILLATILLTGLIGISSPASWADDNAVSPVSVAPGHDGISGAENGSSGLKTDQGLTVTAAPPMTAPFGSAFKVAATASSGLVVSITSTGACMGSGNGSATITMISGSGLCKVRLNQSGDADYAAAPELVSDTAATTASQDIRVTRAAPATAVFGHRFEVAAKASSGLAVAISTTGACSGSGNGAATITMISNGSGTCRLHFNQGGDSNYNAAPEVTSDTVAEQIDQTITVTTVPPATVAYTSHFGVAATASSGLPVTITSSGACAGHGNGSGTITMISGTGTCTLYFNQPGDAIHKPAPEMTNETVAAKIGQTITVTAPAPATAPHAGTYVVAAVASSNLAVAITSSGACTGSGSESASITMISGAGTCTLHFNQPGDANYQAADETTNQTTAIKADQTVSAAAVYATTFEVVAGASSGLPVAIATSGVCTGSGTDSARIAMTSGTGTCRVHYHQAGDANYNAASEASSDIMATKARQAIRVTMAPPAKAAYASTFKVSATASSGLAVAITTSGTCMGRGSGSARIAMTSGTGTCTLHYNQAGDTNFLAAAAVTEEVTADKAVLTVAPNPAAPIRQYSDRNPFLSPAYSGFAAGDGVDELAEEPRCATSGEPTSAPGSYPITCAGGQALNYTFTYDKSATLTVVPEEATIEFGRDNPAAVKGAYRRYSRRLSLQFVVREKQPDAAAFGAAAGAINSAALTVTLSPLMAGGSIKLNCKAASVPLSGYAAGKTFTCTNGVDLGVDVYEVSARVTGNYAGEAYDGLTVYDQTLGSPNGGGWFYWPGTEDRTHFGFVMKSDKDAPDHQGQLLVVRHHADGSVSRLTSRTLTSPVLQNDPGTGCGTVTFSGQADYTAWDPSANAGLGGYVSSGGNPYMAYAEDCNNPGTGLDYFLVRGVGDLQMSTDVYENKVPFVDQGHIVVPHDAKKAPDE